MVHSQSLDALARGITNVRAKTPLPTQEVSMPSIDKGKDPMEDASIAPAGVPGIRDTFDSLGDLTDAPDVGEASIDDPLKRIEFPMQWSHSLIVWLVSSLSYHSVLGVVSSKLLITSFCVMHIF